MFLIHCFFLSFFLSFLLRANCDSILCGDHAIKQIEKPFIGADEVNDWTL